MFSSSLSEVRYLLESMEDTILCSIFDRSRYYFPSEKYWEFKKYFQKTEQLDKRFKSSFSQKELFFQKKGFEENIFLYKSYIENILPKIAGDKKIHLLDLYKKDITVLQLLSERIHYGIYVAESKYQNSPALYQKLIETGNEKEILTSLTNKETEERIILRIREKASHYSSINLKFPIKEAEPFFVSLYEELLIPLTKKVELKYLLKRGLHP